MIEFEHLTISFTVKGEKLRVLRDCSFGVAAGQALALVGESGSGKSTALRAVLGDVAGSGRPEEGTVRVCGSDVFGLTQRELTQLRRREVGYVPQNPGASLNPVRRAAHQVREVVRDDVNSGVTALFERVHLPTALGRRYPYELSGGQQQRLALAVALANNPKVLLLDEPTTGLDVRTQAEILALVKSLAADGLAVLYVTHDLAAAGAVADRVVVLYAGEVLEEGSVQKVYRRPAHPYTSALLGSIPTITTRAQVVGIPGAMLPPEERENCCVFHNRCRFVAELCTNRQPPLESSVNGRVRCFRAGELTLRGVSDGLDVASLTEAAESSDGNIIRVAGVSVRYRGSDPEEAWAVRNVTFDVARAETLAVVGESGSGKTSLARAITGLVTPVEGTISLGHRILAPKVNSRSIEDVRRIQYVFQNSTLALNPRHTTKQILGRPLGVFFGLEGREAERRCNDLLDLVRLPRHVRDARPRALSGGEQQRVAIARALAATPELVICDEILAALDVSIQAAMLDLLGDLQTQTGTSYLFISHDLALVRSIADRTAVMERGEFVELSRTNRVFESPQHAYTRMLLEHAPDASSALR